MKVFSNHAKEAIFTKTEGHCAYCGKGLSPFYGWHIEHMTPVSKGGTNDLSNLVAACPKCNRSKYDRTVEEFRAYMPERVLFAIDEVRHILNGYEQMLYEEEALEIRRLLDEASEVGTCLCGTFFIDPEDVTDNG